MAKYLKLDVFSGFPNPVWPISDDLATQYGQQAVTADQAPQGLGYRGFQVLDAPDASSGASGATPLGAGPSASGAATTEDQIGSFTITGVIAGASDTEKALLQSGVDAGAIGGDLAGYVGGLIGSTSSSSLSGGGGSCPPCGGADAPAYNPGRWNNDPAVQRSNNCYAYANDQQTNTFPQPGRGSGQKFASLACDDVRPAAERDGLTTVSGFQGSQAGWYVALVIWPGQDYHWYRQDSNGCWSHKPGQTPARNVDNSGATISDPSQADRGPYTTFCTFMVTNSKATIS